MVSYIARRLLQVIPLLLVISFISFGLYQLQPGDPVKAFVPLELQQYPEEMEKVRRAMGLDRHWTVQYVRWMGRIMQGDMGNSYITGEKVAEKLGRAIPRSLRMNLVAFVLGFTGAVAVGVLSATRRHSLLDQVTTVIGFAGIAIPSFWLGIMLMFLFAVKLRWLPATGMYTPGHEGEFWDGFKHMMMPVFVLAFGEIAGTSRYIRSSLLEVLRMDYIRTARSKGLAEKIVIYRHALRNALIPVVTFLGLGLPGFIGGSIVLEQLFAWPGMGRVTIGAVFQKDYPVIMGANIMFALLTVIGSLVADVLYAVVDPRVKYS